MTRIIYKLKDGWGEARELSSSGKVGELIITVDPILSGYISIGGVASQICDGQARFSTNRIADGEHTPIVSGEMHAELEPILKSGNKISLLPTSDKTIRKLLQRLERAEEAISTLTRRIDKLGELYGKKVIF